MTKTRRDQQRNELRAMARLLAQARLNVGDAQRLGRDGEAAAWLAVCDFLVDVIEAKRAGIPTYVPARLF